MTKNRLSRKASAWVLAGAVSLVTAAAATAAIAGSENQAPAGSSAERIDTYLQAAQKALQPAGISVSGIDLAATRDGVAYYALRGDKDHCIFVVSSGAPSGAGNALGCAPNDSAKPLSLPVTDAESRTVGYALWTDNGALSANASDSGASLRVTAGQPISFVELATPGQGINGTWTPSSGERETFSVPSAAEIENEYRATRNAAP